MLDNIIVKKLGIIIDVIDIDKSYMSYDSTTCYNIIELYLKKEDNVVCPRCCDYNVYVKGSRITETKTASADMHNVLVRVHRRVYKCCNSHQFSQENPLSPSNRKITVMMDVHILNALRDKTRTYSSVAKEFGVSPTYVVNLFDKKVDLKRLILPQVLCIDEVYSKKLTKHSYCCVLYAPQWRKIVDIIDSRHKLDLIDYFSRITLEEKSKVEFISMDLWDSYKEMAKICFPKAKISADPFHVVKNLTMAFQRIRIQVMNKYEYLKQEGDNYYWLYKKFWKLLVMDLSRIEPTPIKVTKSGMYMTKYQIVDCMLTLSDKLKLAYEIKEEYRNFVATATIDTAEYELNELIIKFKEAHIPEYANFIKIMNDWHDEIINSFNRINGHKITNGPMERVNRDIKTIFGISFGSTNFVRVRNRVIFCINEDAPILPYNKSITNKRVGKSRGKYNKKKGK